MVPDFRKPFTSPEWDQLSPSRHETTLLHLAYLCTWPLNNGWSTHSFSFLSFSQPLFRRTSQSSNWWSRSRRTYRPTDSADAPAPAPPPKLPRAQFSFAAAALKVHAHHIASCNTLLRGQVFSKILAISQGTYGHLEPKRGTCLSLNVYQPLPHLTISPRLNFLIPWHGPYVQKGQKGCLFLQSNFFRHVSVLYCVTLELHQCMTFHFLRLFWTGPLTWKINGNTSVIQKVVLTLWLDKNMKQNSVV